MQKLAAKLNGTKSSLIVFHFTPQQVGENTMQADVLRDGRENRQKL